jgi:hypothetical protein
MIDPRVGVLVADEVALANATKIYHTVVMWVVIP